MAKQSFLHGLAYMTHGTWYNDYPPFEKETGREATRAILENFENSRAINP